MSLSQEQSERNKALVQWRSEGLTLDECVTRIALEFSCKITKQRVSKILHGLGMTPNKRYMNKSRVEGITKCKKAQNLLQVRRSVLRQTKREVWCLETFGCSMEEVIKLNGSDDIRVGIIPTKASGRNPRKRTPCYRFWNRKRSSESASGEPYLTFPEWCKLWTDAGFDYHKPEEIKGKFGITKIDPNQGWFLENAQVVRMGGSIWKNRANFRV